MKRFKKYLLVICPVFIIFAVFLYFRCFFNQTIIRCNSREVLEELIRKDFSKVEITDIQYKQVKNSAFKGHCTEVFVFLNEYEELESNEYYYDSSGGGVYDSVLAEIPPGHVDMLKEIGIERDQIQKHGANYNQIKVGFSIAPYMIHWYQIDVSYDGKSNVVLLASIPRLILINAEAII